MADVVHVRNMKLYKPRLPTPVSDFKALYRFEEENVQWLAYRFLGENDETRGGALSPVHKMKICLRYLADPGYQKGIGQELGVGQATVSRTVHTVVDSIMSQASEYIKFPTTNVEIMNAKQLWQSKYNFPTAIGTIDCSHIGILKSHQHGDEYINRRGKPTLNIQATCDANEKFTSVDVSWPGSVHDSRIWKNSQVCSPMQSKANAVLIGDQGYGLEPCLMTPFTNPTPGAEHKFNVLLKKERVIIERCFGQLKRRFPILQYVCRCKLEYVPKVIVTCIVLHNIAKHLGDPDFEDDCDAPQDDEEDEEDGLQRHGDDEPALRQQGLEIRRNLSVIINNFNV